VFMAGKSGQRGRVVRHRDTRGRCPLRGIRVDLSLKGHVRLLGNSGSAGDTVGAGRDALCANESTL
jgi:hypothetical protein